MLQQGPLFTPNVLPGSLQGTSGFLRIHKVSSVVRQDNLKWRGQRTDLCAPIPLPSCVPGLSIAASPPRASLLAERRLRCTTAQRQLGGPTGQRRGLCLTPVRNAKIVAASFSTLSNHVRLHTLWYFDERIMRIEKMPLNREENVYDWKRVYTVLLYYYLLLYWYIITFYYRKLQLYSIILV